MICDLREESILNIRLSIIRNMESFEKIVMYALLLVITNHNHAVLLDHLLPV